MDVTYEDFSLWLEPDGPDSVVRARSPAGEDSDRLAFAVDPEPFLAPFSELTLARSGTRDLRRASGLEPRPRPEDLGDRLYQALFPPRIRDLYEASRGTDPRKGLRLKLHLAADTQAPGHDGLAALSNLPWELAYRRSTRDLLGINRLSPVVRYLELPRPAQAAPFKPPLRVLAVAANPSGSEPLALEQERRQLQSAWKGSADVEVIERASTERFQDALRQGPFHVVHFMGHGTVDGTGVGRLFFEDAEGGPELVSAEVFANVLKGRMPRLVVLNACRSAETAGDAGRDFFAGMASALVLGGLPAVVAMRTPISDRAALTFSKTFYKELAAGEPVDAAAAEARLAIYRTDPGSVEWATPVVFMRVSDGRLFAADAAPEEDGGDAGQPDLVRLTVDEDMELADAEIGNVIGTEAGPRRAGRVEIEAKKRLVSTGKFQLFNRKNPAGIHANEQPHSGAQPRRPH
jgi:hypothetical protein